MIMNQVAGASLISSAYSGKLILIPFLFMGNKSDERINLRNQVNNFFRLYFHLVFNRNLMLKFNEILIDHQMNNIYIF